MTDKKQVMVSRIFSRGIGKVFIPIIMSTKELPIMVRLNTRTAPKIPKSLIKIKLNDTLKIMNRVAVIPVTYDLFLICKSDCPT